MNERLRSYHESLDRAFPEKSVEVSLICRQEAHVVSVAAGIFTGRDWRDILFPEENNSLFEAFSILNWEAKLYYSAAYMMESFRQPFYMSSFFSLVGKRRSPERKIETAGVDLAELFAGERAACFRDYLSLVLELGQFGGGTLSYVDAACLHRAKAMKVEAEKWI